MFEAVAGFVLGTILGSFVKATAEREVRRRTLKGRSYCPKCKRTLRWYDLLPVLSYLFLRGRCRYCANKIPIGDLLAEVIVGVLVGTAFFISPFKILSLQSGIGVGTAYQLLDLVFKMFFITVLSIIFWVDLKSGFIPDKIIFPATVFTALYLIFLATSKSWFFYQNLLHNPFGSYLLPPHTTYLYNQIMRLWMPLLWSVLSGTAVAAAFAGLIIITRGRGMGWGDVKYVFFLGLALGFPNVVVAVLSAFFLGAALSLVLIALRQKKINQTIPFGPFLSLGAIIALYFGPQIVNWYLNFSRGSLL